MYKICILMLVLALLVVVEIWREQTFFEINRYEVRSEKLPCLAEGQRWIILSDLHNCTYGEENRRLLEAIRKEKPDLILIAGDMLVGKEGVPCCRTRQFVQALAEQYPVYYANGNHEQRMKEEPEKYGMVYPEYKKALLDAGVIFLENESVEIPFGTSHVRITGLEVPEECYRRGRAHSVTLNEMVSLLGDTASREFQVLLAHQPSFLTVYQQWGADLVVSGHLHGGLVRIPGIGAVVSPQLQLFPPYSGGFYREGEGRYAVVSRGLGAHTIKLRFFNMPELVVLDVNGT